MAQVNLTHNLLWGILALETGFISRDALTAGLEVWRRENATPLGHVLVEQGVLTQEGCQEVDALVAKHLELHGNNLEQLLAAEPALAALWDQSALMADPDHFATLSRVGAMQPVQDDPHATREPAVQMLAAPEVLVGVDQAPTQERQGAVRVPQAARVSELLACWQEMYRQGQPLSAAELCANDPELLEEVQARIAVLQARPGEVPSTRRGASSQVKTPLGPVSEPESLEGVVFAGYQILEELGRGGMGIVYKARQINLNRLVALKMILGGTQAGPEQLGRFRLEVEAVGRLQHPNIVQIYEVGALNGRPFCSLELINGGTLGQKLAGQPQPPRDAARLVEILAHAMVAAHQQGIVHRDLKPGNVLLTSTGIPKITDFGLAKQLDDESWKTHSGVIMGTPSYMAPEQASGMSSVIGPATDVYSLGAILYETLTGRPPFVAASLMDTLDQVRTQEPVPPRRLQPKLPRDLETICLKCLEKTPARRYPNGAALADDLRRFLANEPIQARRVRIWERAHKWARRRPAVAALVAVSAVALVSLVTGVGLFLNQQASDAKQKLSQRDHLDDVRVKVEAAMTQAHDAMVRGDSDEENVQLNKALAMIGPEEAAEPTLTQLQQKLEGLLQENQGKRGERAKQEAVRRDEAAAQTRYRQFLELRDSALFHGTLATGEGVVANLELTRQKAHEALALFKVDPDTASEPDLEIPLSPGQKSEIRGDCYELLLVLAEATAPDPTRFKPEDRPSDAEQGRQVARAIQILDRAAAMRKTPAYHLRRRRYLERLGKRPEAEQEDTLAKESVPTEALDYYLLGDEHYKRDEMDEAIHNFENALRLKADYFWARYFLAVAYLRVQRPAEARVHLTDCLNRQPADFVWTYLLRGFANAQLNDFTAAEADFSDAEKLIERNPSDAARHVLLANHAVLRLQQAKSADAPPGLQRALLAIPGLSLYQAPLSVAQARRNLFLADAAGDLRKAIEKNPKQYQAYVSLAQLYQEQQEWQPAAELFDQAIALEPGLAFLHRGRARLHLDCQDLTAALRDIEQAIKLETAERPDPVTLAKDQAERGRILHRSQRYPEALQAYDAALQADRRCTKAYLWRAETLLRLERYAEAMAAFNGYLEQGGVLSTEFLVIRGQVRAKLGQYEQAIEDYTRAVAIRPEAATYVFRGWALVADGTYRGAVRDFEEAVRLNATNGDAYNGCGYARARLGQFERAILDAQEAARLGAHTSATLYGAGRVLAEVVGGLDSEASRATGALLAKRSELQDQALALLRKAVELLPENERRAFWWKQIDRDPAWRALRRSPGYMQLERPYLPRPQTEAAPDK